MINPIGDAAGGSRALQGARRGGGDRRRARRHRAPPALHADPRGGRPFNPPDDRAQRCCRWSSGCTPFPRSTWSMRSSSTPTAPPRRADRRTSSACRCRSRRAEPTSRSGAARPMPLRKDAPCGAAHAAGLLAVSARNWPGGMGRSRLPARQDHRALHRARPQPASVRSATRRSRGAATARSSRLGAARGGSTAARHGRRYDPAQGPASRTARAIEVALRRTWMLVGAGPDRAMLEAFAWDAGMARRDAFPRLAQSQRRCLRCWPAADTVVLPSIGERGLANAWIEALACGCPLVITEAGGARGEVADTVPRPGRHRRARCRCDRRRGAGPARRPACPRRLWPSARRDRPLGRERGGAASENITEGLCFPSPPLGERGGRAKRGRGGRNAAC